MTRIRKWYPLVVVIVLISAVLLTVFSPIYPDEVAYKIFLERYFITGGFKQSVTPFCPTGFMVKPGISLIPSAIIWSFVSHLGDTWLSYRLIPYICLFTIYGLLGWYNFKQGNHTFWPLLLISILGPTLYGVILFRPEIIILAASMILFTLAIEMLGCRVIQLLVYSFLVLLIFSLIAYIHPKALYLSVLVMTACTFGCLNLKRIYFRAIYATVVFVVLFVIICATLRLHLAGFLSCGTVPAINKAMQHQAANPIQIFQQPHLFFHNLHEAIKWQEWRKTLLLMTFHPPYSVGYLPNNKIKLELIANVFIKISVILLFVYVVIKSLYCLFFLKDKVARKQFYLIIGIMLGLFTPYVLSIAKHFYEASSFAISLMIVGMLLWPLESNLNRRGLSFWPGYLYSGMASFMILLGMACAVISYYDFTLPFRGGYQGPSQTYAIHRRALVRKINNLLLMHHVPNITPIIVSDVTYDAVKYHPIVLPITYLMLGWTYEPDAVLKTLKYYHTEFGVVSCSLYDSFSSLVPTRLIETVNYRILSDKNISNKHGICLFRVIA